MGERERTLTLLRMAEKPSFCSLVSAFSSGECWERVRKSLPPASQGVPCFLLFLAFVDFRFVENITGVPSLSLSLGCAYRHTNSLVPLSPSTHPPTHPSSSNPWLLLLKVECCTVRHTCEERERLRSRIHATRSVRTVRGRFTRGVDVS